MTDGFSLEQVDEIGSTSEALKARAASGAPGEVALLARWQSGGHGRHGRTWRSVDGNLHLSVLLRPQSLRWPGHWSLLAAVALADAVREYVPDPGALRLKWPNDLLLVRPFQAKLAGILLEAGIGGEPWLVIGFGVNLAVAPVDLERPTACLADLCPAPPPDEFASHLLDGLHRWRSRYGREGFAPVRAAWLAAAAHTRGESVAIGIGSNRIQGTFCGIGPDGALL